MKTIKGFIYIFALTMVLAVAAISQTLTTTDGTRVDISAQKGKVVVLAVGASWLPLSSKQAEYTNAIAKKYAGKNVVVYFIATDSTNAKSKNFASNEEINKFAFANKLAVPVLRDSDGAATLDRYDIEQVPSFVVLDKTGTRSGAPFGGIDPKYYITVPISKLIDKLL